MKVITVIMTVFMLAAGVSAVAAEEPKGAKKDAVEKSGSADWMASFWSKVVKSGKKQASAVPTAVAGLRGAEQEKDKELTPYWKGKEKSKDGAAMGEIETLINKKEFASAIEALKTFAPSYPDSPLKPTSMLILGYCYTQTGKTNEARSTFERFLKEYPDHELAGDAKTGIEILKGEGK